MKNALSENLHAEVMKFRARWEPQIAAAAYRAVTITLKRGEPRTVYLVTEDDGIAKRFWSKHETFIRRIESDREKIKEKDPGAAKEIDLLLPFSARGCFGVRIKKYVARSQRKPSPKQVRKFLARIGKDLPEGTTDFCIRSRSGYRYKLIVRNHRISPEFPLRTWNVILSARRLSELDAPSEAIRVKIQSGNSAWASSNGWTLLGSNSGIGGKDGKSFLYCRMKKSKKKRI